MYPGIGVGIGTQPYKKAPHTLIHKGSGWGEIMWNEAFGSLHRHLFFSSSFFKNLLGADGAQQLDGAKIKGGPAQEKTLGRLAVTETVRGGAVITADPYPDMSLILRDPRGCDCKL